MPNCSRSPGAVLADPEHEGVQLIARDAQRAGVGFASVFWSWDTTEGTRIGIMNDLFVAPEARGTGLADALIALCAERAAARGASRLEWQTAPDNVRAQPVMTASAASGSRDSSTRCPRSDHSRGWLVGYTERLASVLFTSP